MAEQSQLRAMIAFAMLFLVGALVFWLLSSDTGASSRGALPPLHLGLGEVEIRAYTTNNPSCPPSPCPIVPTDPRRTFYAVWVATVTREQGRVGLSYSQLLALPIGREP